MVVAGTKTLRYAITDLSAAAPASPLNVPNDLWIRLRPNLIHWAEAGVDFVQIREKSLHAGALHELARHAMKLLQHLDQGTRPQLLINSRPDIAAAARADGVHLTGHPGELHPEQVRTVFRAAGLATCIVSVSCHTFGEVQAARHHGADLILFGPVFEKRIAGQIVVPGTGLPSLAAACAAAHPTPVLGLGGIISPDNATACLKAGAAGVAGIRLFHSPSSTPRLPQADDFDPLPHEKIDS